MDTKTLQCKLPTLDLILVFTLYYSLILLPCRVALQRKEKLFKKYLINAPLRPHVRSLGLDPLIISTAVMKRELDKQHIALNTNNPCRKLYVNCQHLLKMNIRYPYPLS